MELLRARRTHLVAQSFKGKLDEVVEFPAGGVAEGVAPSNNDLSFVLEAFSSNGPGDEELPSFLGIDVRLVLSDVDNVAEEYAAEAESAGVNKCANGHAIKGSGCQAEGWLAVEMIEEASTKRGSSGRFGGHEGRLRGRNASGGRASG